MKQPPYFIKYGRSQKKQRFLQYPRVFWFCPKTALSFHSFPIDSNVKGKWIQAIRREEGPNFVIKKGSTYVCSRDFTSEDYTLGCSVSRLIPGDVPSLFPWKNFKSCPKRESIRDRSDKRLSVLLHQHDLASYVVEPNHNYTTPPQPGERFLLEYARICYRPGQRGALIIYPYLFYIELTTIKL